MYVYIYIYQMKKKLYVVEDMKQNITYNQYKIIMESLMEIDKINYQERNKLMCLFNWLDTKIDITDDAYSCIVRRDLQKYVITNYFDNRYHENIDFVKQILRFQEKSKGVFINISMSNLEIYEL
jgi:hypothetical protein